MLSRLVLEGRLARLEPLEASHAPALAEAAAENRASYGFTWVPDGSRTAAGTWTARSPSTGGSISHSSEPAPC